MDSHDYVFWCGDLNYRIDLPREEVLQMIENNKWLSLQEEDQLIKSRESGLVMKFVVDFDKFTVISLLLSLNAISTVI